ncbi:MAG TPA: inorganic diphosphatase [Anaeromyxobacteraceae bacterium]|nr:inorganic diphosphatase [Anaeromyxobacteraceae bacterium]
MIDLLRLPPRAPSGAVHVVVESPRGSRLKLKLDADLGVLSLSRPLPLGLAYPYDWGFVPGTVAQDGDPLDALVCWEAASFPGVVLPCRLLGAVLLEHDRRRDGARVRNDRLIVRPVEDERGADLSSALDLPRRVRDELEQFFLHAIFFEPKNPRLLGWEGPEGAAQILDAAVRAAGRHRRRART